MNPDFPQSPQPQQGGNGTSPYSGGNSYAQPQYGAQPVGQDSMQSPSQPQMQPQGVNQEQGMYAQTQYYGAPASPQPQFGIQQTPPTLYASAQPIAKPARRRHDPTKKFIILMCVFIFTTVAGIGVAAWAYVNYLDQKNNVDLKVSDAEALARKNQKTEDDKIYQQAEKEPNRTFTGPTDYGSLSFEYPKTWSVYEVSDASDGGTYEAIFNPGVIPPEGKDQQYALRLTIEDTSYEKVVSSYDKLVKKGDLKTSSVTINDQNGTRLDGNFSDDIRGAAIIIKIRDKTVTLRTEANTFLDDYNKLLKTITFVK